VRQWRNDVSIETLLIAGLALVVTYLAVVAVLGFTEDDRLVLDAVRHRKDRSLLVS